MREDALSPKEEFSELVDRSGCLVNSVLMLLVMFAHLVVSVGSLFCNVFVTVFRLGRTVVDRITARITIPRGGESDALRQMELTDPAQ